MLITMLYMTLYYIVFWIIPFSNSQIIKTPKEIVKEKEAKRKKKEKKAKEEAKKSGDNGANVRSNSAQSSTESHQVAIPKINDSISTQSTISAPEKR
jgi:sortase (surface protein transpeptidase)